MNADTIKQIQESLTPIAAKIGEGAAHLYEITVRQIFAEGIAGIVAGTLLLLILIAVTAFLASKTTYRGEKVTRAYHFMHSTDGFAGIGMFFFYILVPLFTMLTLYFSTLMIINPEYYAIERIVNIAKGQ